MDADCVTSTLLSGAVTSRVVQILVNRVRGSTRLAPNPRRYGHVYVGRFERVDPLEAFQRPFDDLAFALSRLRY